MRVLELSAPGEFAWCDVPEPKPRRSEVLARVHHVGICGTDLHAFAGRQPFFTYPRRLGHELCVVPISGSDRVPCAVNPYLHCGRCQPCRAGRTNCCENLEVLGVHRDGGLAPMLRLPRAHLYPCRALSAQVTALVEPLVVGRHAVRRARIATGERVLVVGAGPIGLAVGLFVRLQGADLVISEPRPDRREAVANILDPSAMLSPGPALAQELRAVCGGDLPTVVFDATGNLEAMHTTFDLVAHGGRYVFVGHYPGAFTFHEPDFHRRELTLLASRNGTHNDFVAVIRALEEGLVDASSFVTHRFAFAEVPEIFADLSGRPGVVKAVVDMG